MEETAAHRRRRWPVLVSGVVIFVLVATCGYWYLQYRQAVANQQQSDNAQIATLTARLGKTIVLPSGQPAVVNVVDKTKLTDPQLAAQAENGDQLLIYATARRVILYRPSAQKVIDMFHITTSPEGIESTSSASTTAKPVSGH